MNDERYQKIMSDLGMPNSRSLLQALQQVANEVGQQSSEEITRLRAELAKVTWQRNEAQAGLAASRAECERMREALMRVQNFPGHPGGHTADVSADADDSASWRHGWICAVEAMQEHAIPRKETE